MIGLKLCVNSRLGNINVGHLNGKAKGKLVWGSALQRAKAIQRGFDCLAYLVMA